MTQKNFTMWMKFKCGEWVTSMQSHPFMTNCMSMINSIHDNAFSPHFIFLMNFGHCLFVSIKWSNHFFQQPIFLSFLLNFNFIFSNFSFFPAPFSLLPPYFPSTFPTSIQKVFHPCPALPCPDTSRLHMFTFIPKKKEKKKLDYFSHCIVHNTKLVWAEPELCSISKNKKT